MWLPKTDMTAQLLIGIMSGTSLDGVDAALVAFDGDDCQLQNTHFLPYPDEVKSQLLALHKPQNNELEVRIDIGLQACRFIC